MGSSKLKKEDVLTRRIQSLIQDEAEYKGGGKFVQHSQPTVPRTYGSSQVQVIGSISPKSLIGGRVFKTDGIAPSIMAGTHGYGFGYILTKDED